jgi:sulfur carrier protein
MLCLVQLTVNGRPEEVPDGLSVSELVARLGLTEGPVAVERNREVVPRARHGSTRLENGDVVEIVHFVGGG